MDAWQPILVAVVTSGMALAGIWINGRRERSQQAVQVAEQTESQMVEVLRERILLRDERLSDCVARTAILQSQIDRLMGEVGKYRS